MAKVPYKVSLSVEYLQGGSSRMEPTTVRVYADSEASAKREAVKLVQRRFHAHSAEVKSVKRQGEERTHTKTLADGTKLHIHTYGERK